MIVHKRYTPLLLLLFFMIVFAFGSCNRESKKLVMSEGKMTDVLYDYHIADGISRTLNLDSTTMRKYIEAVFSKHGIGQSEFDSSMVYYMRHADMMNNIYERLEKRIENEARLQGLDGSDMLIASNNASGDTANIWNMERVKVLSPETPYNMMRFSFKADSAFRAGDRFMLKFKTDFIYQDGMRNGYVIMTMRLQNDSIITQTSSLTSPTERTIQIEDHDHLGVKEIKGYFIHRQSSNANDRNSSTVKMMILKDITLIKMHTTGPIKQDSINKYKYEKDDSTMHAAVHSVCTP